MRRVVTTLLVLSGSAANSQTLSESLASKTYNKCLHDAFIGEEIKVDGKQTFYSCFGDTAKGWFDRLSGERKIHDKNGLFIARYYAETGYCAHQIEDAAGNPVSAYVCEIVTEVP